MAQRTHATCYLALSYLKLCLDVFARYQQERAAQVGVVAVQAVAVGLVVCREPVILDAVQVAQTRTQAVREVLRLHTVHHVYARLAVLGG